jgi:hypothetical protein
MRAPAKLFAISLLFILCNARASTTTSEITDMWWNPAESGWGVNIILQNSVVFATFFVYDANHNPVWYTAPVVRNNSRRGYVSVRHLQTRPDSGMISTCCCWREQSSG